MKTTDKTITILPMYESTGKTAGGESLLKVLPEPLPFVKFTVEVRIGFKVVKVEYTEDCLASCNHDKHMNAIRQSEIAVFDAFREFFNSSKEHNAHNAAPAH